MTTPLRLRAEDAKDLAVISSCLQDALTCVADLSFLKAQRRFVGVFTRFMWEETARGRRLGGRRVRSGLHLNFVNRVVSAGIDQDDRRGLLPLLAIRADEGPDGAVIVLEFGGGASVRLEAECVDGSLADISRPWTTQNRPSHPVDD